MYKQSVSESDDGGEPPRGNNSKETKPLACGCEDDLEIGYRVKVETHHVVGRKELNHFRLNINDLLASPIQKYWAREFWQLFLLFRPPLIDVCHGCHIKIHKKLGKHLVIKDEAEYYRAVEEVCGPAYMEHVYFGIPWPLEPVSCDITLRKAQISATGSSERSVIREPGKSFQPLLRAYMFSVGAL